MEQASDAFYLKKDGGLEGIAAGMAVEELESLLLVEEDG